MKNRDKLKEYYESLKMAPIFNNLTPETLEYMENSKGFNEYCARRRFSKGLRFLGSAALVGMMIIFFIALFGDAISKSV